MYERSIFFLEVELEVTQEVIHFTLHFIISFDILKVCKIYLFKNENTYLTQEDDKTFNILCLIFLILKMRIIPHHVNKMLLIISTP